MDWLAKSPIPEEYVSELDQHAYARKNNIELEQHAYISRWH